MKIWITGIAGFLGSHLADTLRAEGHEVSGNDNLICGDFFLNKEKCSSLGIALIDCRDWENMRQTLKEFTPDVIIHCAATAHEGLSSFSPSFITKNIYEASVATFSAAIAAGVKRIVHMSSMSRYGHGYQYCQPPFTEDMPTAPVDPYGIAKVATEETLRVLCETHGVNYSIAVPHNIIGIRQRSVDPYRNVAAIMINRCKQGKAPIIYGDGSQKRCFSPVKDCIPSLIKMINGEADGEIVNIGPDNGEMSVLELAEIIMELTDCHEEIIYMLGRPNEVKDAYCSSDKARRLLGYKPQQKMRDCLKEMVDYIQSSPFVYDFPIEISKGCPETWLNQLL